MSQDKSPSAIDLLEQVCDIMDQRNLGEVHLREGTISLRVRRAGEAVAVPAYTASSTEAASANVSDSALPMQSSQDTGEFILCPMVGRFYRSEAEEAPPFVEEGATVSEDDTICLIEAMKIFNPLKAEFACEILEVLPEDGAPVEYGQPLFRIKRT